MKKLALLLSILLLLTVTGCKKDIADIIRASADSAGVPTNTEKIPTDRQGNYPNYTAKDGTWAIYMYICGSNLESDDPAIDGDAYGLATRDITEIVNTDLPDSVNVIMQMGGSMNWNNQIDPTVLARYSHGAEGTFRLEAAPQANMGNPATLADFLTFCNTEYPAEHQVVILWNHGGGSLYGFGSDENFNHDGLSLPELNEAFAAAPAASGQYDIIGFDVCLMATVDVVAALKDAGNYLVASEDLESGEGWYYTGALEKLAQDTTQSAADFARAICDSYYQRLLDLHNENNRINSYQTATLSVVDLDKADSLLSAYNAMADEALLSAVEQKEVYLSSFGRAARVSENYGYNTAEDGFFEMVDLGDLAANAAALLPKSKAGIDDALRECVVYQVKGPLRANASGVSCYYCYSGSPNSVASYNATGGVKAVGYYYEYSLNGSISHEGLQYINSLTAATAQSAPAVEELPPVTELDLIDFPISIGPNGHWQLNLGPERAKSIAAVYNYMLLDSRGELKLLFGISNEIDADWQNGIFTENYTNMWGSIDNVTIFMQAVGAGDGYVVYSSPIILNDSPRTLFVSLEYDALGNEEYTILGVRETSGNDKSMTTKELAPKDLLPLQAGDKLEPILYFLFQEGEDSWRTDAFPLQDTIIGESPDFRKESLGDGHFQMMFCMVDYAGKSHLSSPGDFKIKEGIITRTQGWAVYPKPADATEFLYFDRAYEAFNPRAKTPYYTANVNTGGYAAARASLGLPNPDGADAISDTYAIELFTNDPSINLENFVGEMMVYATGHYVDGRAAQQHEVAFEVTGIMAAEGATTGDIALGTLAGYGIGPAENPDASLPYYDMYSRGVLQKEKWLHEGRNEWLTSYYVVVDAELYTDISNELGGVEDICGQGAATEIQIYTTDPDMEAFLDSSVGMTLFFEIRDMFEAHTEYHRRNIVMEIAIMEIADLSGFAVG